MERRDTDCRPNGLCSNPQSIAMKVNMGTQRAAEGSQAWTTAVSRPAQEGLRPYLKVLPWAGLVTQWQAPSMQKALVLSPAQEA